MQQHGFSEHPSARDVQGVSSVLSPLVVRECNCPSTLVVQGHRDRALPVQRVQKQRGDPTEGRRCELIALWSEPARALRLCCDQSVASCCLLLSAWATNQFNGVAVRRLNAGNDPRAVAELAGSGVEACPNLQMLADEMPCSIRSHPCWSTAVSLMV